MKEHFQKISEHWASLIFPGIEYEQSKFMSFLIGRQMAYNRLSGIPCPGLSFMYIAGRPNRCNQFMCPSCFMIEQAKILQHIAGVSSEYFYVRNSVEVKWDDTIAPQVVRRMKAHGALIKLVAYSYNPVCECPVEDAEGDFWKGEMGIQILGVYKADRAVDVRDKSYDSGAGEVEFLVGESLRGGKVMGTITQRTCVDVEDALETYLEKLGCPFIGYRHPLYPDYIQKFKGSPFGKSWHRKSSPVRSKVS